MKYKALPLSHVRRLHKIDVEADHLGKAKSANQIIFEVAAMEALAEEVDGVVKKLEDMPESEFKSLVAQVNLRE